MNIDGWKEVIKMANQDNRSLELLAKLLEQQDKVAQILREKGYGVTGESLLDMVNKVK